jgi:TPR repeat protein
MVSWDRAFMRPSRCSKWTPLERKRLTAVGGATVALALVTASSAIASPIEEAEAAYARGEFAAAAQMFMPLAERGDQNAQFDLGVLYVNGQGVPKDDDQANAWFRKSAARGDVAAEHALALRYLQHHASGADYPIVFNYCLGQANVVLGQRCLGYMYAHGDGVVADMAKAILYWRQAATQGDQMSQDALGSAYEFGHGVPVDFAQAAVWYRMSAEQGNPWAMFYLGYMAVSRPGQPPGTSEAVKWLDLSLDTLPPSASQYQGAIQLRANAAGKLSPAELAGVAKSEAEWRAAHRQ